MDFTALLSMDAPAEMPIVSRKMVRQVLEEMGEEYDGGHGNGA